MAMSSPSNSKTTTADKKGMTMNILATNFYFDGRTTTCVIDTEIDGVKKTFVGTSRRDSADKNDTTLGRKLAEARAMQKISNKMMKRVKGMLRHQDNMIAMAERNKPASGRDNELTLRAANAALSNYRSHNPMMDAAH